MSALIKPTAKPIVTAIRWNEAVAYIEAITGRDIRDWEGRYRKGFNKDRAYHDFWHWIASLDPHNGCVIALYEDHRDRCQGEWVWAQEVLDIFLREFGEGAKFWIEW